MATQHYNVTPVWGLVGGTVRLGGRPGARVTVTDTAGATVTVTQDGRSQAGFVLVATDGTIGAFSHADQSALLLQSGGITWTVYSSEAVTATAAAQTAASAAAVSAAAAAASAATFSGLTVSAASYCVGNGTTDDTTGFTAALAAAAAGGKRLTLPPGFIVRLTSQAAIPAGVTISGGTLRAGASMARIATLAAGSVLDGVTFDSNGNVTSYVVSADSVAGVRINRCAFNGGGPIAVELGGTVSDVIVSDSTFTGQTNPIRIHDAATDVTVARCRFTSWVQRAFYILGTASQAPSGVTLSQNIIGPHGTGGTVRQPITFEGDDSRLLQRVAVVDNLITCLGTSDANPTTPGSADAISLHRVRGFVVRGNHVSASGDVGITVAQQCSHGVVSGNVIETPDSVGFCIGSSTSTHTTAVTITGNTVRNTAQERQADGVPRARAAYLLNRAVGCVVEGNVCVDDQGTKTTDYGLSLVDTVDCTIGPNAFTGWTVAPSYAEGTNVGLRFAEAPTRVVKTADTVRNNTLTVSNDPHLVGLPLSPGAIYRLTSRLKWNATTTADLGLKWSAPSGTTIDWTTGGPIPTAASANTSTQYTPQTVGSTATLGGVGGVCNGFPEGVITVGSTAGTLALQWAQGTAAEATDCTLYAGSWVQIERIG